MADNKILNHADREEIIQKLLDGVSPEKINKWLISKYPDDKSKHITSITVGKFRKEYLNIDQEAARIIKRERQLQNASLPHNPNALSFPDKPDESEEAYSLRVKDTLLSSPNYRDRLKGVVDAHLDAPRLMKELHALLEARIEVYFNEVAGNPKVADVLKADKMFLEFVALAKDLIGDFKKIENEYNAVPDEGTIDLNVVQEQIGIVRDVVKELLTELDPNLALEFMDKLNTRLSATKYQAYHPPNVLERVDRLSSQINQIKEQKLNA